MQRKWNKLAQHINNRLLSYVQFLETSWTTVCQVSMPFTISQGLLKLMYIELVMPSNHFISCWPHLLLPSVIPRMRVFSNELALCIMWPNYWSFSISPSNKYSELISFRIDWFDLLALQGTLKSLCQNHSSKELIIQCSVFFIVQFLHPYLTTVKTTVLTKWTFVSKARSLVFNTLSSFIIAFLLRTRVL